MTLYLVRHAIAEDFPLTPHGGDEDRPLSAEGRQRFEQSLVGMRRLELAPTHVFSSPYLRTRQTAALLVAGLGFKGEVREDVGLVPHAPPVLPSAIKTLPLEARVVLVGHEPHLSQLISVLLTGHDGLRVEVKKGSLTVLELGRGGANARATLLGLYPPRILRGEG